MTRKTLQDNISLFPRTQRSSKASPDLFPDHREDLQKSGITLETAQKAGLYSVEAKELEGLIGWVPQQVKTALVFPYPTEDDGFCRVKVFPSYTDEDGSTVKYLQRKGSGCRLYIPPKFGIEPVLGDRSIPAIGVEGEKKALAVAQAAERAGKQGQYAIYGLGGLWNWLDDGTPILGFGRFAFVKRSMLFFPDSDVWLDKREDLRRAIYAYGMMCEGKGATFLVHVFSPLSDGSKCGADDYLVTEPNRGLDDLLQIPSIALKHKTLDEARQWWKGWSQKAQSNGDAAIPVDALIQGMKTERLIHPAQDYADGVLYFGVPVKEKILLVTSKRQAIRPEDLPNGLKLDNRGFDRCDFSPQGIQAYLAGQIEVTTPAIVKRLEEYFRRFAIYPQNDIPLLLSLWTLGTYIFSLFEYYPYLALRSPQKRCGKSRVEDLTTLVAFNASQRETNPTAATLFRGPAKNRGTLILDEVEMFGQANHEAYGDLLSVLNSGFQRGGVVPRTEKRGERFDDVKYPTYVPRMLAGIKKVSGTLEDRSIQIFMQRKRRDQKAESFSPRRLKAETQEMKDHCYVWALTFATPIESAYQESKDEKFPELATLDDRAKDMSEPLMTIAYLADEEAEDAGEPATYAERLGALLKTLFQVRDEGEEETTKLVKTLIAITQEQRKEVFSPTELLSLIQAKGFDWVKSTAKLAEKMNGVGFFKISTRIEGKKSPTGAYRLTRDKLQDLQSRYVPNDDGTPDEESASDEK
jgi:hypothetical protein